MTYNDLTDLRKHITEAQMISFWDGYSEGLKGFKQYIDDYLEYLSNDEEEDYSEFIMSARHMIECSEAVLQKTLKQKRKEDQDAS